MIISPDPNNAAHRKKISGFLGIDLNKSFSYIVFASRSELKKVPSDIPNTRILRCELLESTIQYDLHNLPVLFSQKEVDEIYAKLLPLVQLSAEEKQKHIEYVRKFSEGQECPVCGGKLELIEYNNGIGKYRCTKCSFERTDDIDVQSVRRDYRHFRNFQRKNDGYDEFIFGDFGHFIGEVFDTMSDLFGTGGKTGNRRTTKKQALNDYSAAGDSLFTGMDLFGILFGEKEKSRSSYKSNKRYKKKSHRRYDSWDGGLW